jgi:hypothetical protein
MELESSSPYPQVPASCPYPEPTQSSPHEPLQFPEECVLHKVLILKRVIVKASVKTPK